MALVENNPCLISTSYARNGVNSSHAARHSLGIVDGRTTGGGRVEKTCGYLYGLTDGADIGVDTDSVIVEDFDGDDRHGHFEGTIHHVVVDIDPSAHPDAEGYVSAALRRQ